MVYIKNEANRVNKKLKLMMQLSGKVYGYQIRYFGYITCKKTLLCYLEKSR